MSCIWNHAVYSLFRLASFTYKIHLRLFHIFYGLVTHFFNALYLCLLSLLIFKSFHTCCFFLVALIYYICFFEVFVLFKNETNPSCNRQDKINTMEMEKHFLNVFMAKIRDDFILPVHSFHLATTKILGRDKELWSTQAYLSKGAVVRISNVDRTPLA